MADTSIVERRSQLSESQSALLQREKELEEKEKHLMDMVKSKSSDETVLQNLSACLVAERQALAHRWSAVESETKAITNLEQAAFSVACNLGGKLASSPWGDQSMTREADGLLYPLSDWPNPRLQTSYCAIWSVQQIQLVSLAQQQQQADMPCFSCCFQR